MSSRLLRAGYLPRSAANQMLDEVSEAVRIKDAGNSG